MAFTLPDYYPGPRPITPFLGLGLWGMDEAVAIDFIKIDQWASALTPGSTVEINSIPVSNPNFEDSATVTFSVAGSVIKLTAVGSGSGAWATLTGDLTETQVIPFDGGTPGTPDSGISRIGAASLAIGNGSAGDFTGSLKLKSVLVTDTAANTDLTLQNTTAASALASGYNYSASLTVGPQATALSNFPILVSVTIAGLRTTGNGGNVQNASGYDIIFSSTSNPNGSGILPFEIVSYNAATGALIAFFQASALSATANSVFYLLWDNSAISTDQSNKAGVWSNGYVGVWHFGSPSVLSLTDSTGNGTATNHGASAVAGVYDGGVSLPGSPSYVDTGNTPTLSNFTIEMWLKGATGGSELPLSSRPSGSTGGIFLLEGGIGAIPTGAVAVGYSTNGSSFYYQAATSAISSSAYSYVAGSHTAGSANIAMYFNGAPSPGGTVGQAGSPVDPGAGTTIQLGRDGNNGNLFYTGNLAEVRVSSVVRSPAWVSASYSNQNSPSTFVNLGAVVQAVTNQSSPLFEIAGAYYSGAASVSDYWTLQNIPASTGSVLNIANTGGSTAPAVNVPALQIGGISAEIALLNNGLGARFYPEAYGAKHTLGVDDSVAIQQAIAAASANGGGTVVLGPYTYYTSSTLTVTTSCVNVVGNCILALGTPAEGGSCIMNTTAGNDVLQMTGTSLASLVSNRLENIGLFRSVKPTGTACGLKWTYCLNTIATNVFCQDNIYNFSFNHIVGSNNHIGCISYWTTTSAGAGTCYGFWFDGNGNNSTDLTKCISSQVGTRPVTTLYGLYLSGGIIADLYCDELNTAFTNTAVYIASTNNVQPGSYYNDDVIFTRCIHDTCLGEAYSINNVYGNQANIQILGGYLLSASSNKNLVTISNSTGVILDGVGIFPAANANAAVYLTGSNTQGCVIENNVIYNTHSGQTMIQLNSCSNNRVAGNSLQAAAGGGTAFGTAISLTSATYNVIEGNNIFGYGTTGISLDSGSTNNVGTSNSVNPSNITNLLTDAGSYNTVVVNGSQRLARVSKSGNYTTTVPDNVIVFTATATLTLDSGAAQKGTTYRIKLGTAAAGGSVLTVSPNNSKTIDNAATLVMVTLGQAIDAVYDGTSNWDIF